MDLDLLVPDRGLVESGRRLHGCEAYELEDVALDHVPDHAGLLVVAPPALYPDCLRGRDLDVVYVIPVPDGLEYHVGKAKRQDVLDRLLSQVVVDPVDLVLAEDVVDGGVQLMGGPLVYAEGLLHHYPPPGRVRASELRPAQLAHDYREELRRSGQIEQAIHVVLDHLREGAVALGVVVSPLQVRDVLGEPSPRIPLARLYPGVLHDSGAELLAEGLL